MLGVSAGFMRAACELLDAAGLAVYPDKRAIDFPSSFFCVESFRFAWIRISRLAIYVANLIG